MLPLLRAAQRAAARLAACALAAVLSGCAVQSAALRQAPPAELAAPYELAATPFFAQEAYQCGPAALATVLRAAGLQADPQELGEQVFLPARSGTLQLEMMAGARRQGAVATRIPPTLDAALREVRAGQPVVVLQNLGLSFAPRWHYAVLVGYDLARGEVQLRSGSTQREVMALRTFEHTWARSSFWGFVALPPGRWPATAQEAAAVEAAVGFERAAPPREAVVMYRSAVQRWPGSATLAIGLGNSLHASGDLVAAAAAFRAAAVQHGSAAAWINLAQTLRELGDLPAARTAVAQALASGDGPWADAARRLADELAARGALR